MPSPPPPPRKAIFGPPRQGTAKGGLDVLDLVRCKAEQKQRHDPPALGAFLQCKGQDQSAAIAQVTHTHTHTPCG